MSEDINAYKYDFTTEVVALRKSLGALGDKFIYANLEYADNQPPKGGEHKTFNLRVAAGKLATPENVKTASDFINQYYKNPHQSSEAFPSNDGYFALAFNNLDNSINVGLGPENAELMRLFAFYHETAHALIPGGPKTDSAHAFRECAADAYAALL